MNHPLKHNTYRTNDFSRFGLLCNQLCQCSRIIFEFFDLVTKNFSRWRSDRLYGCDILQTLSPPTQMCTRPVLTSLLYKARREKTLRPKRIYQRIVISLREHQAIYTYVITRRQTCAQESQVMNHIIRLCKSANEVNIN